MKHVRHELHDRRLIGVVLRELERELEGPCTPRHRQSLLSLTPHRALTSANLLQLGALCNGREGEKGAPPSQDVSSGPKMTAFQCMMLSGLGAPFTPAGRSSPCRRLKSRISRCRSPSLLSGATMRGCRAQHCWGDAAGHWGADLSGRGGHRPPGRARRRPPAASPPAARRHAGGGRGGMAPRRPWPGRRRRECPARG